MFDVKIEIERKTTVQHTSSKFNATDGNKYRSMAQIDIPPC